MYPKYSHFNVASITETRNEMFLGSFLHTELGSPCVSRGRQSRADSPRSRGRWGCRARQCSLDGLLCVLLVTSDPVASRGEYNLLEKNKQINKKWSSCRAAGETNLTSSLEVVGSIPGLFQGVKDSVWL